MLCGRALIKLDITNEPQTTLVLPRPALWSRNQQSTKYEQDYTKYFTPLAAPPTKHTLKLAKTNIRKPQKDSAVTHNKLQVNYVHPIKIFFCYVHCDKPIQHILKRQNPFAFNLIVRPQQDKCVPVCGLV